MLAAYHLARATDLAPLCGVADIAAKAGVANWKPAKVAVFVDTAKGVDTSLVLKDGPKGHTLWGYLAWRLAGQAGLDLMADAEAARTSPASELLVETLPLPGPALILLDELVACSPATGRPFRGVPLFHPVADGSRQNGTGRADHRLVAGE